MKDSLLVHMADGSTRTYPIEKHVTKIGRASDNDIVLVDVDRSVSRWHAAITTSVDGSAYVEDLNSANGTLVNGWAVKGLVRLNLEDVIGVGGFRISLRKDPAEDDRFRIQAGTVALDELQKSPELLPLAGPGSTTGGDFKNVELLYEVGVTLARSHSIAEVTRAAIDLLFKIEHVHRATVMLWDEKRGAFGDPDLHVRNVGRTNLLRGPFDPTNLVMSRTILNRVRQENRPLLIRDANSEEALNSAASIIRAEFKRRSVHP
jgi:pSer/pThr/pTyr-binding forkhead associated (FHA) protein